MTVLSPVAWAAELPLFEAAERRGPLVLEVGRGRRVVVTREGDVSELGGGSVPLVCHGVDKGHAVRREEEDGHICSGCDAGET